MKTINKMASSSCNNNNNDLHVGSLRVHLQPLRYFADAQIGIGGNQLVGAPRVELLAAVFGKRWRLLLLAVRLLPAYVRAWEHGKGENVSEKSRSYWAGGSER